MNPPNPMQYSQPLYPAAPSFNRTAGPMKIIGIIYAVLAALSVFGVIALAALAFFPTLVNQQRPMVNISAPPRPKSFLGSSPSSSASA